MATDLNLDWRKLLNPVRRKSLNGGHESIGTGAGREELERDYDRLLFLAATRRLADKTQVFPMEQIDSVRTRLTHSLEVSNLARSIGVRIAFNPTYRDQVFGDLADELKVERTVPALLAAVGLAHDLGNPPFGHQGEKAIGNWFKSHRCDFSRDFEEFDGNRQTLRLLTKLQILNDEFGLNLTCACLAALMKYPVFQGSEAKFKKFGIFESERSIAEQVWEQTGLKEGTRHPLVFIMEACDDIAYSVIDAEDTIKKGYASFYDLIDHLSSSTNRVTLDVVNAATKKNSEFKKESISSSELNDLSMQMFRVKAISEMVVAATEAFVKHKDAVMSGEADGTFTLIGNSECSDLCQSLKQFDKERGFWHPAVLRLELEGNNYITNTMTMLWRCISNPDRTPFTKYGYGRISENYRRVYEKSCKSLSDMAHLLCDAISGMTDSYLISVHNQLTELDSGATGKKCQ